MNRIMSLFVQPVPGRKANCAQGTSEGGGKGKSRSSHSIDGPVGPRPNSAHLAIDSGSRPPGPGSGIPFSAEAQARTRSAAVHQGQSTPIRYSARLCPPTKRLSRCIHIRLDFIYERCASPGTQLGCVLYLYHALPPRVIPISFDTI